MHSDFYINLCVRHWVSALHLMFSSSQFFALVILSLSKHKNWALKNQEACSRFAFHLFLGLLGHVLEIVLDLVFGVVSVLIFA